MEELDFDDELYATGYRDIIHHDDCESGGAAFQPDECSCDCIGGEY